MLRNKPSTDNSFTGPHQGQPIAEAGAPAGRAKAGMIMLHGRGATAKSILSLSDEFAQPDVRYLAPQADTHTWYPHPFTDPLTKNQPQLSSALQAVSKLIKQMNNEGIPNEKIVLLGFSQGACLALEYTARYPQRMGGIIGLSGGLIGEKIDPTHYTGDLQDTPVFIGVGTNDHHLPMARIHQSAKILRQQGANVTKKLYPDTGHKVVEDEIKIVRGLLSKIIHN
ncbi:alpha/beta hydrolase [Fodinibius halophilus]|uniref:Alpha/beta fold hydrolase n=1 Tax=Fodinibius halophilus TaxID=1736908 RepID=A0A6M1TGN9_9BACT|nr:alpha/beta fold hydrolase [Fodinibius halophilus]NGP89272.1 alpha/beta fold hydrolase [Fodinibius halophilus]